MKRLLGLTILSVAGLLAQTTVKVIDGSGNERIGAAAGVAFDSGVTTIVTGGGTTITATTTKVQLIHCNTLSSTSSTVTIKDGNAVVKGDTLALAANAVLVISYGSIGLPFAAGVKIIAGTSSALSCQVVGVQ